MKKLQYTLFIFCLFGSGLLTVNAQLSHIEGFGIGSSLTPENSVNEIIVDSLGNFYAIGTFAGTLDFNPLGTPFFLAANAGDAFIAKYNSQRELVWAHALGGPTFDFGLQIAFGKNNDLLVGGTYNSTVDFNPSPAPEDTFFLSEVGVANDIFLARFDTSGNFIWAGGLFCPNSGIRYLAQLLADETGNIIAYGHFDSTVDFDPAIGTSTTRTTAGSTDLFVLKLSPEGEFIDVQQFGSTSQDLSGDLVFVPGGNYFISGSIRAPVDFDPSASSAILAATTKDGFIAKYSSDMHYLAGIVIAGPYNFDGLNRMDINATGTKILVNGVFSDSLELNPLGNSFKVFSDDFSEDIFAAVYDTSLHLITGFKIGGAGSDASSAIRFEAHTDNFWIAGNAPQPCDFDPSPLFYGTPQNASNSSFVAQYDSLGNYRYSYAFEGSGTTRTYCLEYRNDNELLIAGKYSDIVDLDFNPNAVNSFSSPGSGSFMFLGSYDLCRANYTFNNEYLCQGDSLLLDGNYYTSGDTLTIYNTTSEGCDSVQRYSFFTSPSDFTPVVAPAAVCSGSTFQLQADSNLSNVQWETGFSGSVLSLNAPENEGVYVYAYSALLNGCTVSDSAEIEVNGIPALDLGDDLFLCENEDVDLVISGPVGNFIYIWSTGDTQQFIEVTSGSLPVGSNQIALTVIDTLGCSATDSLLLQVDVCLNTYDLAAEAASIIFPNPCNSKIWIVAPQVAEKNYLIRIYTLAGQLVHEQFAVEAAVDVSALSRGLYILTVVSNNSAMPVMFLKN